MRSCSPLRATLLAVGLPLGLAAVAGGPGSARWPEGEAIPVWIESPNVPPPHRDLVRRALSRWSDATEGALTFREVEEFPRTGIRIRFVIGDGYFGEAMPSVDRRTGRIFRADVILSVVGPGDTLQRQLVLYLTALHEIGHALGLDHTDDFGTIMYRFRRPEDPERYFRRYRKRLGSETEVGARTASGISAADRQAIRRLYAP